MDSLRCSDGLTRLLGALFRIASLIPLALISRLLVALLLRCNSPATTMLLLSHDLRSQAGLAISTNDSRISAVETSHAGDLNRRFNHDPRVSFVHLPTFTLAKEFTSPWTQRSRSEHHRWYHDAYHSHDAYLDCSSLFTTASRLFTFEPHHLVSSFLLICRPECTSLNRQIAHQTTFLLACNGLGTRSLLSSFNNSWIWNGFTAHGDMMERAAGRPNRAAFYRVICLE